jgi:DNA-binding winged helix-turn-helix (wHTH) protein
MRAHDVSPAERISFGGFDLFPVARLLVRRGTRLPLGSRAMDLLIVLVERAGEVVTHRELMRRVWRDLVVESGNLRVQMAALRRALGDGEAGARYIANIPGQGYSFVAPLERSVARARVTCSWPVVVVLRA